MVASSAYKAAERERAITWKHSTATLSDADRAPGVYTLDDGTDTAPIEVCLPQERAALNLLPDVRDNVITLLDELGVPWQAGGTRHPSNHLLSSQVQCANALGRMVEDPDRLRAAFGHVLDMDEVVPIEPHRFLTFEYIGATDYFDEAPGSKRTRGSMCTSVDAAFLHRTSSGSLELALVEWKYTESYGPRPPTARQVAVRRRRYVPALCSPVSPLRWDVLPIEDLFTEPLYQLVRQQLLAHQIETDDNIPIAAARVIHVLPPANHAYQQSLHTPSVRALGDTVDTVWTALLRSPDRFVHLDPEVFADPDITSHEYCRRYGHTPTEGT